MGKKLKASFKANLREGLGNRLRTEHSDGFREHAYVVPSVVCCRSEIRSSARLLLLPQ
jgi:hypothetical protein